MDQPTQMKLLTAAVGHHQAGRVEEAEPIYRKVLAARPDNVDALHLLGVLLANRGNMTEGLPLLEKAARLLPGFVENIRDLGYVYGQLGRSQDALNCYARVLQANPRDAGVRADVSTTLFSIGRHKEALEQSQIALQIDPNNPLILGNYGYMLTKLDRFDDAIKVLTRAAELGPNMGAVWSQLAEGYWRAARYREAVAPAKRAAELLPNDPRMLIIYGNTLQTDGQLYEAAAAYRRSIELDPNSFDSQNNLGLTLLKLGDAREAAAMYEKILARWPESRDAMANQSLTLLTLGDFEKGFAHYEARTTLTSLQADRQAGRLWDGSQDLKGKTILLASEQGFGDTIHFVRYAPLVAEKGAEVLVGSPVELVPVVSTVWNIARVIPVGSPMPKYEYIIPMGSLPKAFGTRVETIPADVPYMSADPAKVTQWRERLAGDANVKVGIAWAGSAQHQNDRARSCQLSDFAPLGVIEGVTFYSIQKGAPAKELDAPPAGMKIIPVGHDLKDFSDTAALLECLDLLISVDTSVVHMAGALARPVWTLIARGPDWRWMIEREDTPWYPTMRLLRQTKMKEWGPVLDRAANDLRKFVADARSAKEKQT